MVNNIKARLYKKVLINHNKPFFVIFSFLYIYMWTKSQREKINNMHVEDIKTLEYLID